MFTTQSPDFLFIIGADGETRTRTAFATAPSRQRVYQFHHVGLVKLPNSILPERINTVVNRPFYPRSPIIS